MDLREYPDDALLATWTERYGATGVKFYELELHPLNAGCVAAYRELTVAERGVLARLEALGEGAVDVARVGVSMALLYPPLDSYPHPAFAVAELFPRIRQHGHGALDAEEPLYGGLPAHMALDIRTARRTAQTLFEDPHFGTIYRDLAITLAASNGTVDIQTLDYLWHLPPGRLRDLMAALEQTHHIILQQQLSSGKLSKIQRTALQQAYASPFAGLDAESGGATVPGFTPMTQEHAPESSPTPEHPSLPPNRPLDAFRQAVESL